MKILVIVDTASQTHPDLERAVEVVQREGGIIELFACNDEPGVRENLIGSINVHEYRELLRERTLEILNELARPLRERGLVVTTCCEWHPSRAQGIFQYIRRGDADLLAYRGSLVACTEHSSRTTQAAAQVATPCSHPTVKPAPIP